MSRFLTNDLTEIKSNCFDIAEVDKEQCGYPGITPYECEHVFKCCYNTLTVYGKSCYHPRGRK